MVMAETMETRIHGVQPVIDTWVDCHNVKDGWRGTSKRDGKAHLVGYDPRCSLRPLPIARMPDDDHFVVCQKDSTIPIGAIRLEKRVPRRAKRAMPATLSHARSARKARRGSPAQDQAA
jgi:hypothetical protein